MKFLFGVVFGALGMWAYQSGKLQSFLGGAPEPVQQAFKSTSERVGQAVNSDQVRQVASTVQEKVQQAGAPQIATPSAAEVAGRPSEPLPRNEPEGMDVRSS
jgi:hypothetical protein